MPPIDIISIPEVYISVRSHLTRNELYNCILVCQAWLDIFSPALYETIVFLRPPKENNDLFKHSLRRYCICVRSICLLYPSDLVLFTSCPNVQELNLAPYVTHYCKCALCTRFLQPCTTEPTHSVHPSDNSVSIIGYLPWFLPVEWPVLQQLALQSPFSLTKLTLMVQYDDEEQFLQVLKHIPNLSSLELFLSVLQSFELFSRIIFLCPKLQSLVCHPGGIDSTAISDSPPTPTVTEPTTTLPSLRTFMLNIRTSFLPLAGQLRDFLTKCGPTLQAISLPPFNPYALGVVLQNDMSCLQGLDLSQCRPYSGSQMGHLLSSIRRHSLRSLNLINCHLNENVRHIILERQCRELESLFLDLKLGVSQGEWIQSILASCPKLRVFKTGRKHSAVFSHRFSLHSMAPSPSPSILEDKAGMIHLGNFGGRRSVAIPYAPWACMELEQLDLLFATVCTTASISTSFLTESTTSSSSPPPPSSSPQPPPLPPRAQSQRREGNCMAHDMFFCKEQQRHHYAQLSQLKDLKRLAVKRAPTLALQKHDAGLDWTLASGMDQLSTLTELRVFIVPGEESMFGLAELKWAKQAWPKLEYIEGLKGCDEEIDQWQQENWADLIFK